MTARPMDRLTVNGRTINRRTRNMLRAAADLIGVPSIPITQGSYNAGVVQASGGTHDRGGVIDVPAWIDGHRPWRIVWALRVVGFAAWHRTPDQGPWGAHVHAVAIGDPELAPTAADQVDDYRRRLNGLVGDRPDDGPRLVVIRDWGQVRQLPPVILERILQAAASPTEKVAPWQVRRVQRALGMDDEHRTGRWDARTQRRYEHRSGITTGHVTRRALADLSVGQFLLTDLAPDQ